MTRSPRRAENHSSVAFGDTGLTGLQELAIAMGVAALLSVGGMFTYRILVAGAGDRSAQVTVDTVMSAAHDVYQETQDYGLIGSTQPTAIGACDGATNAFSLLASYAAGVDVRCGMVTTATAGTVVVTTGELTDGDAGGWIGMAALATDGRCWQAYQPADGPAVYASTTGNPCEAPTTSPPGGDSTW